MKRMLAEYNVHTVLSPFQQHDRISSHQLTEYLKKHHPHITPEMLVNDGWLIYHQTEDGLWKGEVYYSLSDKAILELNR